MNIKEFEKQQQEIINVLKLGVFVSPEIEAESTIEYINQAVNSLSELHPPKPSTCSSCNHCSKRIEHIERIETKTIRNNLLNEFEHIVVPRFKSDEKLTCNSNKSLLGGYRVIETFGCNHHSDYSESNTH